jgi:GH35 family endo-1,4-beta-xylanase
MKRIVKNSLLALAIVLCTLIANGQNTPPSCVITFPHCNAYFTQGTDVTIRVYASDMGGTSVSGTVSKVEFFSDDVKLGETNTQTSNTYSFLWTGVPSGTYRITTKATDNLGAVSTSAGVILTVGAAAQSSVGLSSGKGKYLANLNGYNRPDFLNYWNGVTAENSCKWGSVEATRDVMNWTNADKTYNFAKTNHLSFRYHAIAWGSQYPAWIKNLSPADFQAEIEEYMAAVAKRYPLIDQIDVLNENLYINTYNKKEHQEGTPYFRAGMGGPGVTGYDWAIWLFEKARFYFPNAKLVMNDFELESNTAGINEMLAVIKVLRDRGLIDGFGTQAHYFNLDGTSAATVQNALNSMAKSGLPIYATELDIKGSPASEANQANKYKTLLPVYWNHPAVAGITLWGYVEGTTWAAGTGILNADGTERAAMIWLKSYMESLPDVGYPFTNSGGPNGISQFENNLSISVYPNPVISGKITLSNNSGEKIKTIEVVDLKGLIVKTLNPDQANIEIDVLDLHKGMYFLRVKTERAVTGKKFVIL